MTTQREKLLPCPCPFCKKKPIFGLTKKTGCQLHGDPIQNATLFCNNSQCHAKPCVFGGNIFNGGEYKARLEAVKKWNVTHPTPPLPSEVAEAIENLTNYKADECLVGYFKKEIETLIRAAQRPEVEGVKPCPVCGSGDWSCGH